MGFLILTPIVLGVVIPVLGSAVGAAVARGFVCLQSLSRREVETAPAERNAFRLMKSARISLTSHHPDRKRSSQSDDDTMQKEQREETLSSRKQALPTQAKRRR